MPIVLLFSAIGRSHLGNPGLFPRPMQLLRQGIHPKIVSERLGHSSVAITLDIYSHVMPGMQEDAASRLDVSLGAAIRAQSANIK